MSSTLPTTRSPAPSANRISVSAGVRETIRCGSAGRVTEVPSSSVRVTGNAAAAVAGADGAAEVLALGKAGAWLVDGDPAAPDEQAAAMTRTSRSSGRIQDRAARAVGNGCVNTMRLQGRGKDAEGEH